VWFACVADVILWWWYWRFSATRADCLYRRNLQVSRESALSSMHAKVAFCMFLSCCSFCMNSENVAWFLILIRSIGVGGIKEVINFLNYNLLYITQRNISDRKFIDGKVLLIQENERWKQFYSLLLPMNKVYSIDMLYWVKNYFDLIKTWYNTVSKDSVPLILHLYHDLLSLLLFQDDLQALSCLLFSGLKPSLSKILSKLRC